VLVAMSGGVDSSVAAALLKQQGYEVVGVFMRLGSPGESLDSLVPFDTAQISCDPRKIKIGHQGCCSINDAADARQVAAELDVPFYVVNFKKDFGRIIDYFVDEYAAGRTPNPCVRCNDWLKFGKLHQYAQQIGAQFVASGHYARTDGSRLLRGVDHSKDQSYVLFGMPRAQLAHTLLPIGGFEKPHVRRLAESFGLPTFDKPDSQEICFVPDNDYAGLVERRRPELARAGVVKDERGNVVGEHAGQHRFTIGQRRGVGVALGYPIYVVGKDPATNSVTVGPRELLLSSRCAIGEANWLIPTPEPGAAFDVVAKFRYNTPAQPARARVLPDADADTLTPSGRRGRFEVEFAAPQAAVAAGQAMVLYDAREPDVVLGGGWIDAADPADAR
jgi:tRNA-uridine 2-sulfurtransferase